MATYVLVAGSWHGSWCWSEIVPSLARAGHRVLTPDLLGMVAGQQTVTERPLKFWADQVAEIVAAQDEPVILVGHSRAGVIISEVAERVPQKIGLLVYLCAFLLQNGQTLTEIAQQAANAREFGESLRLGNDGTCTISPESVATFFYNDAPESAVQIARDHLVPEPVAAFMTPLHITESRFGSVRRAYIECTKDRAIPLAQQQAMQRVTPVALSVTLESDHSLFFSHPDDLVTALEEIRKAV